jgi:glycosyltransferase involved in cell wall biosynthesis
VVLVDDGNAEPISAGLARLAREAGVDVVRLPRNAGKGGAVAAGIRVLLARAAPPEAVVVLDADGQHPPAAIPAFLSAAGDAELVVGDRSADVRAMPWQRRLANGVVNRLLALVTRRPIPDSQCGMRLLSGRALTEVEFPEGRYEAETLHLKRCLRRGIGVGWVPIPAVYPGGGGSSFRVARDTLRVLGAVFGRALP